MGDFGSRLSVFSVENVGIVSILLFGREKRAPFIFRPTCAFRAKIRVFLEFSEIVSAYTGRSKNFSKFRFFAAERLRIWLIFGRYSGRFAFGESMLRSDVRGQADSFDYPQAGSLHFFCICPKIRQQHSNDPRYLIETRTYCGFVSLEITSDSLVDRKYEDLRDNIGCLCFVLWGPSGCVCTERR